MTTDEIRNIDIIQYLASRGYHPKRNSGNTAMYLSPLAKETKPSFAVKKSKNRFKCYVTDTYGSIIDLVCELDKVDFKGACDILRNGNGSEIESYTPPKIEKKGVEIHSVDSITDKELLTYFCDVRKISHEVLTTYCKQLIISFPHGKNPDAKYTVVGFKNDMGGYDCRSSWQKIASSPKTITTIAGDKSKIAIYEGFTDFMSHLVYNGITKPKYKTIVLNGLGQMKMLKPFLEGQSVLYYGDNDTPSDNCLESMTGVNVTDMRHEYAFHNDINAFLCDL